MALPTETITVIKNGKLIGPLDCNGQLLSNADPDSFPGGGSNGNDTGTTTAILKGDGNHGFDDAVAGVDYATAASVSEKEPLLPTTTTDHGLLSRRNVANGSAWEFTDPATIGGNDTGTTTALLKGDGAGGFDDAVADTDYTTPSALSTGLDTKEDTLPTSSNDGFVLARDADGTFHYVDPVTLGSTNATFADGATHSNTTFNSTLAVFTTNDTGKTIVCAGNIPDDTTITFVNATTVTLSNAATTTASGLTFVILNRFLAAGSGGTVTSVAVDSTLVNDVLTVNVNNPTTSAQIVLSKPPVTRQTLYGNSSTSPGAPAFMNAAGVFNVIDAHTVGQGFIQLANPGRVCFPKILLDNSVVARNPVDVLTDIGGEPALTFNSPLARGIGANIQIISIPAATDAVPGHLTATDHADFKSKVPSDRRLTTTTPLRIAGQSDVAIDLSANRVIDMPQASASQSGFLGATDFALFSAGSPRTATPPGGITSGAFTITTPTPPVLPITRIIFPQLLTGAMTITLPSAGAYNSALGYPFLEFVDVATPPAMTNFGITLQVASGQYIDGVQNGSISLPRGSSYIRLNSEGLNRWFSTKYFVDAFKDASDPRKKVTINVGLQDPLQPTSGVLTLAAGASTTIKPFTRAANSGIFVTGSDTSGNLTTSQVYQRDLANTIDNITATDITANSHPVPNDGSIDLVRLSTPLTAPLTIIWPPISNYTDGDRVVFLDNSGSITATNKVTLVAANGTDKFNGASQFVFTNAWETKALVANTATGNWNASVAGGSVSGLTVGGYTTLTDADVITIAANYGIDEQRWKLTGGTGRTNRKLAISGTQPTRFHLLYTQNNSGSNTITFQNGATPSDGQGVLTLGATASTLNSIHGAIDETGNVYVDAPSNNLTFVPPPTFTTQADISPASINTGILTASIGVGPNTTNQDAQWLAASNYAMGRIDLDLRQVLTPVGNLTVQIFPDEGTFFNDPSAGVTAGSATVSISSSVALTSGIGLIGQEVKGAGIPTNTHVYIATINNTVPKSLTLTATKGSTTPYLGAIGGTGLICYGKPGGFQLASSTVAASSVPSTSFPVPTDGTGFTRFDLNSTVSIEAGKTYHVNIQNSIVDAANYVQWRTASGNTGYNIYNGLNSPPGSGSPGIRANFITYKT